MEDYEWCGWNDDACDLRTLAGVVQELGSKGFPRDCVLVRYVPRWGVIPSISRQSNERRCHRLASERRQVAGISSTGMIDSGGQ